MALSPVGEAIVVAADAFAVRGFDGIIQNI
jgi:hypothetical protein